MSAVALETSVHGICVQARHEECAVCHALPEQQCHGTPAHPEADSCPGCVHVSRACLAANRGAITYGDAVSVIPGHDGVYAGWHLVLDTEVAL